MVTTAGAGTAEDGDAKGEAEGGRTVITVVFGLEAGGESEDGGGAWGAVEEVDEVVEREMVIILSALEVVESVREGVVVSMAGTASDGDGDDALDLAWLVVVLERAMVITSGILDVDVDVDGRVVVKVLRASAEAWLCACVVLDVADEMVGLDVRLTMVCDEVVSVLLSVDVSSVNRGPFSVESVDEAEDELADIGEAV